MKELIVSIRTAIENRLRGKRGAKKGVAQKRPITRAYGKRKLKTWADIPKKVKAEYKARHKRKYAVKKERKPWWVRRTKPIKYHSLSYRNQSANMTDKELQKLEKARQEYNVMLTAVKNRTAFVEVPMLPREMYKVEMEQHLQNVNEWWWIFHVEHLLTRLGMMNLLDELGIREGKIRTAKLAPEGRQVNFFTHSWDPENPESENQCLACGCMNPVWSVLTNAKIDQETSPGYDVCPGDPEVVKEQAEAKESHHWAPQLPHIDSFCLDCGCDNPQVLRAAGKTAPDNHPGLQTCPCPGEENFLPKKINEKST